MAPPDTLTNLPCGVTGIQLPIPTLIWGVYIHENSNRPPVVKFQSFQGNLWEEGFKTGDYCYAHRIRGVGRRLAVTQ